MIALPAVVVVALVLALAGGGGGSEEPAAPAASATKRADRFDSARAWELLRYQVELGPRPAGSGTLRDLAGYLRARHTLNALLAESS